MPAEVWKYELPSRGATKIAIPAGAKLLAVQNQRERVTLWALVDNAAVREPRTFYVAMTGEPLPARVAGISLDAATFIGTVQLADGDYVAHVFEVA